MDAPIQERPPPHWHSYQDYLRRIPVEGLTWIRNNWPPNARAARASVRVALLREGDLEIVEDVEQAFEQDVRARVFFLHGNQLRIGHLLDRICLKLDVDPFFMQLALHTFFGRPDDEIWTEKEWWAHLSLPSKRPYLGFASNLMDARKCFIWLGEDKNAATPNILILMNKNGMAKARDFDRPSVHGGTIANHDHDRFRTYESQAAWYFDMLERWSDGQIAAANTQPLLMLVPLLRIMSLDSYREVTDLCSDWDKSVAVTRQREYIYTFTDVAEGMTEFQHRIRTWTRDLLNWTEANRPDDGAGPGAEQIDELSKQVRGVVRDYEAMNHDLQQRLDAIQHARAYWSLADSDTSITAARNTGLVTNLAFIFIPLSLVTSIFGMNVRELGTGIPPIWAAFITAVGLTTIVLLIWRYLDKITAFIANLIK